MSRSIARETRYVKNRAMGYSLVRSIEIVVVVKIVEQDRSQPASYDQNHQSLWGLLLRLFSLIGFGVGASHG